MNVFADWIIFIICVIVVLGYGFKCPGFESQKEKRAFLFAKSSSSSFGPT